MKRLVLTVAALAILGVAPAISATAHKAAAHHHRAVGNDSGYGIWDYVSPGTGAYDSAVNPLNLNSPASTGGGSTGYNDSVRPN